MKSSFLLFVIRHMDLRVILILYSPMSDGSLCAQVIDYNQILVYITSENLSFRVKQV
jgi:hypothetical protein